MESIPEGGLAVVVGASGGLGGAFVKALRDGGRFAEILAVSRSGPEALDVTDEARVARFAQEVAERDAPLRLVIDATGFLHDENRKPEKSWREIDAAHMAHSYAVNAIGPMLLMRDLLPLLPREGKAVFATLSAKVGSIGDNHLGGWYSYRAAKAALNQLVRTAGVELARRRAEAICIALHPGTVRTGLTGPFSKSGLDVQEPGEAAARLVAVIDGLVPADSGGFFDYRGERLPW
ncbi:MAG: SDR family NAD(P)-dependent oxidoreductase [Salinarimonadaceae bacterium]|nr:MAG: SDR family NAD(P)-dependent oxidoreductase [Salinarimonadaceae bacterium]